MTTRIGPDLMEFEDFDPDDLGPPCPVCGGEQEWEDCYQCGGEGYDGHDCGEDVCCCLEPEDNESCDVCRGEGGWWWCLSAERHPSKEGL